MTYTTAVADSARAPGVDRSRPHLALVLEPAGSYQADRAAFAAWCAQAPAALALDVTEPDEEDLRGTLRQLQQTMNQISGLRTRIAGELEQRAIRTAGPGRRQQGLREARQRTRGDTRLSPTQVKQDGETGRRLADSPGAQQALAAGRMPSAHARVLAQTLHDLGQGHPQRQQVHDQLVAAAEREDLQTFGRTCRRVLAETDQVAAQKKLDRAHTRRRLRVCETEDGMTAVHGQGTGWDAEIVHTALHAFARPQPRDTRASEQRTWDALVATCRAALDAGAGTTNRAVRPHVLVTVKQPDPGSDPGVVETAWTGPLPWTETRRHLVDAGVSGVLLDANDAPIAVSETVRTVPAGLWKALQVRDKTCIGQGCDVPAGWCQVMHLDVPYRLGGKLSVENAAAGCTMHHRMLDHQGWQITWIGKQPVLHHPDRPPEPPGSEPPQATTSRQPGTPSRPPPGSGDRSRQGGTSRQPGTTSRPPPDSGDRPRQSATSRPPSIDVVQSRSNDLFRPPANDVAQLREDGSSRPPANDVAQSRENYSGLTQTELINRDG